MDKKIDYKMKDELIEMVGSNQDYSNPVELIDAILSRYILTSKVATEVLVVTPSLTPNCDYLRGGICLLGTKTENGEYCCNCKILKILVVKEAK